MIFQSFKNFSITERKKEKKKKRKFDLHRKGGSFSLNLIWEFDLKLCFWLKIGCPKLWEVLPLIGSTLGLFVFICNRDWWRTFGSLCFDLCSSIWCYFFSFFFSFFGHHFLLSVSLFFLFICRQPLFLFFFFCFFLFFLVLYI